MDEPTRGVPTVKERRDLIELVAEHGAGAMEDVLPADLGDWRDYMLQALACELADATVALKALGAVVGGLVGLSTTSDDDIMRSLHDHAKAERGAFLKGCRA